MGSDHYTLTSSLFNSGINEIKGNSVVVFGAESIILLADVDVLHPWACTINRSRLRSFLRATSIAPNTTE